MACGLALILTPCLRRLALRVGALDHPDARKTHRQAMPLLGGVAVYLSFWAAAALALHLYGGSYQFRGLFWGSTLILLLGIYDDLKGLSYQAKFAGQFAAVLILLFYNIKIEFITLPFHEITFLGVFIIPLTLLWVVGLTNAVNLIDGADGLAAGVSAIAALVMFALTRGELQLIPLLTLILAGAALGFLPYNFSPARIFLGDAGSLFLGFMLSVLAIIGVTKQAAFTTLFIPVLILGLPITDTVYAMWRRFRNRRSIFKPDNGHIHHRLLDLGLSTRQTVFVLYFCSVYFGLAAIIFDRIDRSYSYLFPIIFVLFLFGLKRLDGLRSILKMFGINRLQGEQKKGRKTSKDTAVDIKFKS